VTASSPALWGSEFLVNSTTAGSQAYVSLGALKDGTFVAVWESRKDLANNTYDYDVRGQIFYADGTAKGEEFRVNSTIVGDQEKPFLAVLTDGRFAVAWEDSSGSDGENSWGIRGRIFQADGTAAGADFRMNATGAGVQYDPSIAALSNGGFVVAYTDESTGNPDVRSRVFGSNGQPIGALDGIVSATPDKTQGDTSVIGLADGYAVIYTHSEDDGSNSTIEGRLFDQNGVPKTSAEFEIPVALSPGGKFFSSAATLTDGRFVVVWSDYVAADGLTIKAKIFNANGSPVGPEFTVNTTAILDAYVNDRTAVTALPGGGFAVTFTDYANPTRSDIHTAAFDQNGIRLGDDTFVSAPTIGGVKMLPSITALTDGRIVTAWLDDGGRLADPTGIIGRILDPRVKGVALTGTGIDDHFFGTDYGDSLNGSGGNDELYGEGGNDTINGGQGGDAMYGGLGDDTFYYDNAGDSVADSGGTDTVITALSVGIGTVSYIENLKALDGTSPIDLKGNSAANVITGNAGANLLEGDSGDDTLSGGLGLDTLDGGFGDDTYIIDDAQDVILSDFWSRGDIVKASVTYALRADSEIGTLLATGDASINLTGSNASNVIAGNAAGNILKGSGGDDRLFGGFGDDRLYGGSGKDTLYGESGRDIFTFDTKPNKLNTDRIVGYRVEDDTIYLAKSAFTKIAKKGMLAKAAFFTGTKAHDASDRIIYNKSKGELLYDPDGTGVAAAVKFATIEKSLKMTYADFWVF
jgi:serralysin